MKTIPYFLTAGILILGTACSTTTGTGSGTTSGSGTGTSMDATGGTSAAGTGSAGGAGNTGASSPGGVVSTGGAGATGGGAGSEGTGTGAIRTAGTTATSSTDAAGGAGGTAAGGGGSATDMTAFMGTFATMQDPVFLLTAASSNLLEVQAGKLASQQATNADVKKFAQMMVDHHTKATQQLKTVATPLGVTPSETLMPVHQAMLDKLQAKTGKDFDEEYMDMMETAHTMDVAMFEVKSKAAEAPAVQTFATKTLPMLRSHQKMAQETEKKVD